MKSSLIYVAGADANIKRNVYKCINKNDTPYIVELGYPPPVLVPTFKSMESYLFKHTMTISYGVSKLEPALYVCYDYLLPVLIVGYLKYPRGCGLAYVYSVLNKLKKSAAFVVPSYIYYIPHSELLESHYPIVFSERWCRPVHGKKSFQRMLSFVSWSCIVAMQDVFCKTTFFDIHRGGSVLINFPTGSALKKIYNDSNLK